jgi:choice-of-anchor A domain-containing protein/uncharacterized repeat protein (TIGR01451 family)
MVRSYIHQFRDVKGHRMEFSSLWQAFRMRRKARNLPYWRQRKHTRLGVEGLENRLLLTYALGVAQPFNEFILGDSTQSSTESQGRAAIGGNANLSNFGVGDALSNSNGSRDDLIVGRNLTYNSGQVFNGNIVYGGTATLTNVGIPNGTARQGSDIDFSAAESSLTAESATLAALAPTGTTVLNYGAITLTGTSSTVNIFAVAGSDLATANGLNINAPTGATVLVNVSGATDQIQNFGITVSGTDRQHVLYNFASATTLQIQAISVQGSVLAPQAAVAFNNGNIQGTLVAQSLTGGGELQYYPSLAVPPTTSAPDVTVAKTADNPTIDAGQTAGFTVTISNVGTGTATGVTLSDPLPGGLGKDIKWQIDTSANTGNFVPGDFAITGATGSQTMSLNGLSTLSAGQTIAVHITATTTFNDVSSRTLTGTLPNTATVSAGNEASSLQNQSASATITVVAPDVTVQKTADAACIYAGQTAGYVVTLTNVGATTATGLTLNDPLPAGNGKDINWQIDTTVDNPSDFTISGSVGSQTLALTSSVNTLAPGSSLSVHLTGLTTARDLSCGGPATLVNTATVNATNEAPSLQNQKATATITLQPSVPVARGDFATIGFWHNKNGQALIDSLNGGPTSTALAHWLVSNFPNLFGVSAGIHAFATTAGGVTHYDRMPRSPAPTTLISLASPARRPTPRPWQPPLAFTSPAPRWLAGPMLPVTASPYRPGAAARTRLTSAPMAPPSGYPITAP